MLLDQDTNNNKRLLISTKSLLDHDDTNNEHGYQTINQLKDEESVLFNQELYLKIISSKITSIHIQALLLYILSLVTLSFLIFQMTIISRLIQAQYLQTVFEMSLSISLTFFGISAGIVINYYYLNDDFSFKNKVIVCSSITCSLGLLIIVTRSEFIMYLAYPILIFVYSIKFFSISNFFEELFQHEQYDTMKSSLLGLFSLTFLFVFLNFTQVKNWQLFLISSLVLNFSILIFSIFISEEPRYYLKINQEHIFFDQLEKINDNPINEGERKHILEEMKKMDLDDKSSRLSSLFSDEFHLFGILYFIITCLISYVTVGMAVIGVFYCYDEHYRTRNTLKPLFYFLIISVFGPFFGLFLSCYTRIKRKILIITHFCLLIILAFLMIFFNMATQYIGGVFLFFSLSLAILFMKFGKEIYCNSHHYKLNILFCFTIFSFAFVSVLIINSLLFIMLNASLISLVVISFIGLILSIFINLDLV